MKPDQIVRIIAQIGDALAYAHRTAGIVHRDVTPQNVLFVSDDLAKLSDFDLVLAEDTTGGTRTGTMGTLAFAAPEQLERPQDVGHQADVYGLATTAIYALNNGELPPLWGRSDAWIRGLKLPQGTRALLRHATHPDPSKRLTSAEGFARELERTLSVADAPGSSRARRIASGILGAAVGLALLIWLAGGFFAALDQAAPEPDPPGIDSGPPGFDPAPSRIEPEQKKQIDGRPVVPLLDADGKAISVNPPIVSVIDPAKAELATEEAKKVEEKPRPADVKPVRDPNSEFCKRTLEKVAAARNSGNPRDMLLYLNREAGCWKGKSVEAARLKTYAYKELEKWKECARAGKGQTDAEIVKIVKLCERRAETG